MSGSAIYEGWVTHRRLTGVPHAFRYRVFLPLFDLDELPELLDPIALWSARRPAPARFRRRDYLNGENPSLADEARTLAQAHTGRRPAGPVRLLANPRYLGVGFNPVSFYFLHDQEENLDAVIAEVTNTPWGERVTYVLDGSERRGIAITARFAKAMHVSPFQPIDQRYEIAVSPPGQALRIRITNLQEGRPVFRAAMALRRRDLTRAAMVGALFRRPPMTLATLARIYTNALRLRLRGAPYHRRLPPSSPGLAPDRAATLDQGPRACPLDNRRGQFGPLRGGDERELSARPEPK